MKKKHEELIAFYFQQARLPVAAGKRTVSILIRLKPRAKESDDDNLLKVLLDGLRRCGAILQDDRKSVKIGTIEYERGTAEDWGTVIFLEEVQ